MDSHTYKLAELVDSSPRFSDVTVRNAIVWAGETFNHPDWFEVLEARGYLVDDKITY